MLKSWVGIFAIFTLLLLKMAPSPPTPPPSLPHRHRTSVRDARQNAMLPLYAVPRVLPNHRQPPFQDIGSRIHPVQDASSLDEARPSTPSLDSARATLRDADREQQLALQETPSQCRRRIPAPHNDENSHRSTSPTPGASTSHAVQHPSGLQTPRLTPAASNARSQVQQLRRQREAAAQPVAQRNSPPEVNREREWLQQHGQGDCERREREEREQEHVQREREERERREREERECQEREEREHREQEREERERRERERQEQEREERERREREQEERERREQEQEEQERREHREQEQEERERREQEQEERERWEREEREHRRRPPEVDRQPLGSAHVGSASGYSARMVSF
ncbi:hypothetical protein K438DRAFT_1780263 [Mycena galopus ATCC 62051]|nr:hypothetical protein K438DRAFT_1780263 [Mycena galopus ATCC 62051]